ncbi:Uma2 family endonuclease [Spirosoma sp. HMF3257]|uniref:Uma2 family endonuclease n=1 Tax=Spirosoma telluris TaxID=2183553 RepID=A0A327NTK6_9BACT|nr:Uma2 family endonuclease [Spirosoma telluris]RAI77779.1 Uma2 family endonuclease [Spirosoma telluris]
MAVVAEKKPRISTRRIPPALIYEMWAGKPVYYRGYQDVLAGKKSIEEVMSCSDLQGVLVSLLNGYLYSVINRKKYLLATNEIGLHLALNDNLGNDVVLFEKEKLGKLKGKYFDIPPKIVIEVDIKADLSDFPNKADEYIMRKSQKLLDFGVEKVLWVITGTHKVYVIDHNDPTWYVVNWTENITVVDNCVLNIKQLLDDEEIVY